MTQEEQDRALYKRAEAEYLALCARLGEPSTFPHNMGETQSAPSQYTHLTGELITKLERVLLARPDLTKFGALAVYAASFQEWETFCVQVNEALAELAAARKEAGL